MGGRKTEFLAMAECRLYTVAITCDSRGSLNLRCLTCDCHMAGRGGGRSKKDRIALDADHIATEHPSYPCINHMKDGEEVQVPWYIQEGLGPGDLP